MPTIPTKSAAKKSPSKKRPAKSSIATKAADRISVPLAVRPETKTADDKGRISFGGAFANRSVIIEHISDTEVLVSLARVIPEREAWLYENPRALASVRRGLAQAKAGEFVAGPDLDADAEFARQLED